MIPRYVHVKALRNPLERLPQLVVRSRTAGFSWSFGRPWPAYFQSFGPLPASILGRNFSILAVRVLDCLAPLRLNR